MQILLNYHNIQFRFRLLAVFIYFSAAFISNAQTPSFCGTIGGGPGSIGPIPLGFKGNGGPPSGPFYIRVYPHVIRRLDGSGGQTDQAIDAAFARLAADFNPHNIFFVRACEVIDVPVSENDYHDFNIYCDLWGNPLLQHTDGIDMFFGPAEGLNNAGGIASGIPGKSLWVAGTWTIGAGNPYDVISSSVMSHEMGHCLGLWHTHHGTVPESGAICNGPVLTDPDECCELVNGSNSVTCGDYVFDTDADPYMWATWGNPNPCANLNLYPNPNIPCIHPVSQNVTADVNGDIYTPPTDNTMSYQQSLMCITGFTGGQGERMRQVIAISPVLQACLVQPDMVDVIIITNTTWTTANTPNNGDFVIEGNLTIMGGATLTINSGVRVRFGENSKVIIRPNAVVRLSGTLTSMGCSQTWIGVTVSGSLPNQSQYAINGVRAQGRFEGFATGLVENARTAVQLYGPTAAFAGGQISCNGTTFRNNIVGIDFANYLNFWPFQFPAGQQGQPRNYFGTFSRCTFETNNDYPHTTPFNTFIYMSGVNGVNISGTGFANDRDIEGNSIDDWGYGIQSVDAGFTVTGSPNGIVFPPSSYTFSGFRGLGYAVQAQTSVVNRPYIVRQTNFDGCYVGIRNWSVDGATILFNNFNLGDLPSLVPTEDAVGVIFETDVTGFTCEENEFTRVAGANNVTTIGSICINTGDQHKQIRRNTYTQMDIGNLANQQNAVINLPNVPEPIFRGLYYDCNRNFDVIDGTGVDFSVPDGLIRPRQGLEVVLANGNTDYLAAGNRFSYTGTDFSNLGGAVNYYFDPLTANHDPLTFMGAFQKFGAKDNACTQSFCEPPCRNDTELDGIKADYYIKRSSLLALNAAINSSSIITEQQKSKRAYYQYGMDQAAYMVALHLMYDTIHYNPDSLRRWVTNMNSIEGDLWLANDYLSTGALQQANAILDAMPIKHQMNEGMLSDIADVKVITNTIAGQDPTNLNEASLQTLATIAAGTDGFARGWARRLLTQHGQHFAPEYVKGGGKERSPESFDKHFGNGLKVQPNPATAFVTFTLPSQMSDGTLRIFDLNGKVVQEFTNLQAESTMLWNTGDSPGGIYFYHFISGANTSSGKIILNK